MRPEVEAIRLLIGVGLVLSFALALMAGRGHIRIRIFLRVLAAVFLTLPFWWGLPWALYSFAYTTSDSGFIVLLAVVVPLTFLIVWIIDRLVRLKPRNESDSEEIR